MPKIIHTRENCIGCFTCVEYAPSNWEIGEDGKVNLKRSQQKNKISIAKITELEVECNQCAAAACPMGIIRVEDDEGREL